MGKGEETRERIIRETAPLFNRFGFFGSSLADVMKATGLQKGGIYNHFGSKEELALQAFDYAAECVAERAASVLETNHTPTDRLLAYANIFRENYSNPVIPGGCPLLNTAIESDDAHPPLRERAIQAMDRWRNRIRVVVEDGKSTGEFRSDVDADTIATYLIATLEGGVMLSRLYNDPLHINRAVDLFTDHVRRTVIA